MFVLLDLWKEPGVDDFSNKKRVARDSLVELFATTLFVYCGTLGAVSTGENLVGSGAEDHIARILPIAICFGVTIMFMVYSIGHITGGHMNPGVSLLMYFRRQMSLKKMLCYWFCQFLGAIIASSLVWGSTSGLAGTERQAGLDPVSNPPFELGATTLDEDHITQANGFLLELMGSFIFYFVIAQCALDERGISLTAFPAIPIGFSLVVVHICLIPFTGCGVNPARTLGPAAVVCMSDKGTPCSDVIGQWWWIYWIGPFSASLLVAEVTTWLKIEPNGEEAEYESEVASSSHQASSEKGVSEKVVEESGHESDKVETSQDA